MSAWADIAALGGLALLGYWVAGLLGRWRVPEITAFLIAGVILGPHALHVLDAGTLQRLGIVQPIALGLMVFLVGRELTLRALRRHSAGFWVTLALAVGLPAAFVYLADGWLWDGPARLVVLLSIVAVSGAPTTVLAIRSESRCGGRVVDGLLGIAAIDNVLTVAAYSIALPFLRRPLLDDWSFGEAVRLIGMQLGVAVVLGLAGGWALERLLRRARGDGERLAAGVFTVAVVVSAARMLGSSSLLAPLVAGVVVASLAERRHESGMVFGALSSIEYPLYVVFYALAGTELDLRALAAGGLLAVAYIVARSAGKVAAGFAGGLVDGLGPRGGLLLGCGLLPQAGVAVGLALDAGTHFPDVGVTFATVVLAAIVVFELVGPIALRRTLEELGERPVSPAAEGPARVEKAVVVGFGPQTDTAAVLAALDAVAAQTGDPPCLVEIVAVTPSGGNIAARRSLDTAKRLERVGEQIEAAGFAVRTRVVGSPSVERGLATAAADADAVGVILPVDAQRGAMLRMTPLKRRRHRIADALDVPVFLVPLTSGMLREASARASAGPRAAHGDRAGDAARAPGTPETGGPDR